MNNTHKWNVLQAVAASILSRRENKLPAMLAYHVGRIAAGCTEKYAFYKPSQDIYGQAKQRLFSAIRFAA